MTRVIKVTNYIDKKIKESKRNLSDINRMIDEELVDSLEGIDSNSFKERYSGYMVALEWDIRTIAFIYLSQCYRREFKILFTLERFFYHTNIMLLLDYCPFFDDEKNFIDISELGEILLMDFACNDFRVGHLCYDKIIESIQSGKMAKSLPMYTRPQKLGVLAIEMLASEKNQTIDWESAGIPIDPFYQRFCQEALYTKNNDILDQWLITLCDKHIEWSALFSDNSDEQSSTGYEIELNLLIPWPFEYQAVKNFRARHGLTTPVIDHPLLKTPMAIEHRPDMVSWKQNMPTVYDSIIDDLIAINPELHVIHTLF